MDLDRLWLLDQSHKLNTIAQRPSSSSVDSLLGLWVQPHTCIWHNGLLCRSSHLPNIHFYTKEPLCQLRVCVWTHCPRYRKICPIRIHFIDRFRWIHRLFPNLFLFFLNQKMSMTYHWLDLETLGCPIHWSPSPNGFTLTSIMSLPLLYPQTLSV